MRNTLNKKMKQHLSFDSLIGVTPGNSITYLNQHNNFMKQALPGMQFWCRHLFENRQFMLWQAGPTALSEQCQRGADHPRALASPQAAGFAQWMEEPAIKHLTGPLPYAQVTGTETTERGHALHGHTVSISFPFSTSLTVPRGKAYWQESHVMETEMMCNYQLTAMTKTVSRVDSCPRNNT